MTDFGLVTEGITDQVVIRSILNGYFHEMEELVITERQPQVDVTDRARATNSGGWGNLVHYCQSDDFRESFQFIRYIIIHIDTDQCDTYGVSRRDSSGELSVSALVEKTTKKIVEWIGEEFYSLVRDRVIFAISVHEIECWLLPIYFTDRKREKTVGCIGTLNQVLPKREGFSIHAKEYRYYEIMSRPFLKQKELDKLYPHNPSFALFVQQLEKVRLAMS